MTSPIEASPPVPPSIRSKTPWRIRFGIFLALIGMTLVAMWGGNWLGERGRSCIGVVAFVLTACLFSTDIRQIRWRTVLAGVLLQFALATLILREPTVYAGFQAVGGAIKKFLDFTDQGAQFVFGPLADPLPPPPMTEAALLGGGGYGHRLQSAPPARPFIFAFKALPAVIFVSSFFTVLYHLGVLQFLVRLMARGVVAVMGTSGAETLSAVANVFMGQTEAPLIVKPYVAGMTRSELLALMAGGMATISGGVMVAYVSMGADPVAILATSVMAAPAGLYLAKILVPETEEPQTRGVVKIALDRPDANIFDAAARGASEGMILVLNIAAMLIAFIAFIALINHLVSLVNPAWSLQAGFSLLFSPVALLMGVPEADLPKVAELLGIKLVLNEFVAYSVFQESSVGMSPRAQMLAVFALTGFANFSSIGIQLGGIGSMAPQRRSDLARLGARALLGGFLATLVNASIAGILL